MLIISYLQSSLVVGFGVFTTATTFLLHCPPHTLIKKNNCQGVEPVQVAPDGLKVKLTSKIALFCNDLPSTGELLDFNVALHRTVRAQLTRVHIIHHTTYVNIQLTLITQSG